MMCRSVRQTPAPPIRTSTSNGPLTVGSGTSSTTGCWWYACSRTAFIGPPLRVRVACRSMPRQMPLLASRLVRVSRARRRCSGNAAASPTAAPADGVDQQRRVVAGRQAQLGAPRAAAGPGPAMDGTSPSVSPASSAGVRPAREQRPAHLVGAGQHRLAEEVARAARPARRPPRPANDGDEAGPRGDPVVDRVGREVVVQHHLRPADAVHRGHRVVGVGHHEEGEVGRAEVGRQPQLHRGVAVAGHRRRRDEARAS